MEVTLCPTEHLEEAQSSEPGFHILPRDWHQDLFVSALAQAGIDFYGYAEEEGPALRYESEVCDPGTGVRYYVIDTPLFRVVPYIYERTEAREPNFTFKPWSYEVEWYKYPLRDAYGNAALSDRDWALMCGWIEEWAAREEAVAAGARPAPLDVPERDVRSEADVWAKVWEDRLRKQSDEYNGLWVAVSDLIHSAHSKYVDDARAQEALSVILSHLDWDESRNGTLALSRTGHELRITHEPAPGGKDDALEKVEDEYDVADG